MAHTLKRLFVGDEPDAWRRAVFTVENNVVTLGKTAVELVGTTDGRGIRSWSLDGVVTDIDGLPSVIVPDHQPLTLQQHPNLAFAIDHVVVQTSNVDRTVSSFASVGIDERKNQVVEVDGSQRRQSFIWAGRVIVEVVGPAIPSQDEGATDFWGLAVVSANLETASTHLGDLLSEPRDAVQPGRKISTLRTGDLDISVPIALLSPHVANLGEPSE